MTLPTNLGDWPIQLAIIVAFMTFIYWMSKEIVSAFRGIASEFLAGIKEMDANSRLERNKLLEIFMQINKDSAGSIMQKLDRIESMLQEILANDNVNKKARN